MPHHCISHVKDIDGLSSAALVLAAKGGTFRLADYGEVIAELDAVPASATALTICDLGTNAASFPSFLERLSALAKRMPVTYVDHHYLTDEARAQVVGTGVELRHDVKDCAAVLTYKTYEAQLPEQARALALYGAVTDYMDSSAVAAKMMESTDRHYILLESTLLSYALAKNGSDYSYAETLVKELAAMKAPHTIDDVPRHAVEQAEVVRLLAEEVRSKGTRLGRLAYMRTDESATGNVAKLLLGAFGVPVGVAYKVKPDGKAEFSLRGTSESGLHLGKELSAIAESHRGSGGGHQKAAGCLIPADEVEGLLKDVSGKLQEA